MIVEKLWNFLAVAIQSTNSLNRVFIETFVNSKSSNFEFVNYFNFAVNTDYIYIGKSSGLTDCFYIKDFGIDFGGAIRSYDTGGYENIILPNCLLRFYKSIHK